MSVYLGPGKGSSRGKACWLFWFFFLLYLSLLSPPYKSMPPASSGSHLGGMTSVFVGSDGCDGKTGQEHPLSLQLHTAKAPPTTHLQAETLRGTIRGKEACKQLLKTPKCYPLPRWSWTRGFHHTVMLPRVQSQTLWGQEGLLTYLLGPMFL